MNSCDFNYFQASHPRAPSASVEVVQEGVTGLNQILEEVRFLREQQGKMTAKLSHLEKNNTRLWHEVAYMRSEHVKQKTLVNKVGYASFYARAVEKVFFKPIF